MLFHVIPVSVSISDNIDTQSKQKLWHYAKNDNSENLNICIKKQLSAKNESADNFSFVCD